MKKNIVFIILCTIGGLCGHYVNEYPDICITVAFLSGIVLVISHPLSKEIQDYINKKLD